MKIYGIENIDLYEPTNTGYFGSSEEAILIGLIKATKDQGATKLPANYITETFPSDTGLKGLVSSYTAYYDSINDGFYNSGTSQNLYIETTTLYDSANEVSRVVASALSNDSYDYYIKVSLDGGLTWTTASNGLGLITDFTGTSNGGGNYRLKLRYYVPPVHSWVTTSALNDARDKLAGCGTISDALSFGNTTVTEQWNGTSWATTSSLNVARYYLAGCGTTSDALSFGGYDLNTLDTTEQWNGTAWATTSGLNVARYALAGCGTVSNALSFGGHSGTSILNTTEQWSGTAWATTSSLNVVRYKLAGCGTTSNALSFGGNSGSYLDNTELWNGSSWSTTSSLNVARESLAGCGTTSDALSFGGYYYDAVNTTEQWNGTTWTVTSSLNVARDSLAGCGNITDALSFGGGIGGGSFLTTTEQWKSNFRMYGFGVKIN